MHAHGADATHLLHRRVEGGTAMSTNIGSRALLAAARLLGGKVRAPAPWSQMTPPQPRLFGGEVRACRLHRWSTPRSTLGGDALRAGGDVAEPHRQCAALRGGGSVVVIWGGEDEPAPHHELRVAEPDVQVEEAARDGAPPLVWFLDDDSLIRMVLYIVVQCRTVVSCRTMIRPSGCFPMLL